MQKNAIWCAGTVALLAALAGLYGCDDCRVRTHRCYHNQVQVCTTPGEGSDRHGSFWDTIIECGTETCVWIKECGELCAPISSVDTAICTPNPVPSPRCPESGQSLLCDGSELLNCWFSYLMGSTTCASEDLCVPSLSGNCLARAGLDPICPRPTKPDQPEFDGFVCDGDRAIHCKNGYRLAELDCGPGGCAYELGDNVTGCIPGAVPDTRCAGAGNTKPLRFCDGNEVLTCHADQVSLHFKSDCGAGRCTEDRCYYAWYGTE
jgi:hypothetical protein